VRFDGTRWIWNAIQENLRTSARQSTRTTTPRTRPTLPHPTSPPSLDLGTEPELYTTLAKVENRSRHVVVPALVLEHGVAMGEAKHLSDALCVEQVLSGDSRRHRRSSYIRRRRVRPNGPLAYGYRQELGDPGGAPTPRGQAATYRGGHDNGSVRHTRHGISRVEPERS
jgi:hypothetical protein